MVWKKTPPLQDIFHSSFSLSASYMSRRARVEPAATYVRTADNENECSPRKPDRFPLWGVFVKGTMPMQGDPLVWSSHVSCGPKVNISSYSIANSILLRVFLSIPISSETLACKWESAFDSNWLQLSELNWLADSVNHKSTKPLTNKPFKCSSIGCLRTGLHENQQRHTYIKMMNSLFWIFDGSTHWRTHNNN